MINFMNVENIVKQLSLNIVHKVFYQNTHSLQGQPKYTITIPEVVNVILELFWQTLVLSLQTSVVLAKNDPSYSGVF